MSMISWPPGLKLIWTSLCLNRKMLKTSCDKILKCLLGCDTAALHGLYSREFDSCDGTHCKECCESERRADQAHGK